MNNIEELLEIFFPIGLLSQFHYEETIKDNKHYTFVFKGKNIKPVVSESNKKLQFKGYKPITLEDYCTRKKSKFVAKAKNLANRRRKRHYCQAYRTPVSEYSTLKGVCTFF